VVERALRVLVEACSLPDQVTEVVHGSDMGTNAILSRRGPRVALITTEGFRDILEIARIRTPSLYNLTWEKPPPLVSRRHHFEVAERIAATGEILSRLDLETVREVARRIEAAGITAVAVCLISSRSAAPTIGLMCRIGWSAGRSCSGVTRLS
jgi:N-methylhydantoinase A